LADICDYFAFVAQITHSTPEGSLAPAPMRRYRFLQQRQIRFEQRPLGFLSLALGMAILAVFLALFGLRTGFGTGEMPVFAPSSTAAAFVEAISSLSKFSGSTRGAMRTFRIVPVEICSTLVLGAGCESVLDH
jgi:hypothetical protein